MQHSPPIAGPPSTSPFVVAHRAGNDLRRLRIAAALHLPLAEADVHLHRGRLEVRHLKTAGPIPVLWDRWELRSVRTPRLALESLLAAADTGPELMLDLKGHDHQLPDLIVRAIAASGIDRRITVCSQDWRMLDPLRQLPGIRVVDSVGNARALGRLRARFAQERPAGVSIDRRLLSAATAAELRAGTDLILSWPVETVPEARRLADLGVTGLISRSFEAIAAALGPASARAVTA